MYKDYFRFKQKPFSIAPDPGFLYLSDRHREALAHLMYGLTTDGGFVLITGEVGTGKTTLIRSLIDRVPSDLDIAFILNPKLSVQELLETLCDELGVPYDKTHRTVKHYLDGLTKHLLKTHSLGRSTVVVIDEAQNLAPPVLEQIRLLTNLETNERKLLRIILLGQPELAELLDRKDLRQLAQRITARYHLAALDADETRAYVAHRLTLAGGSPQLFTRAACRSLYRLSQGVPRLINIIADRALLGAFVEGKQRVGASVVHKAAREVSGNRTKPTLWIAAAAAAVVVCVGAGWALFSSPNVSTPLAQQAESAAAAPAAAVTEPEAPPVAVPEETWAVSTGRRDFELEPLEIGPVRSEPEPATVRAAVALLPTDPDPEPPPTSAPETLVERPPELTGTESQRRAYAALFERWNLPFEGDPVPCNYAPSVGLQCLRQQGSWNDVLRLDRPAVIELWDDEPDPYYGAVLESTDAGLVIRIGDTEVETTPAALASSWYGTFVVLWQMPPDYRGTLQLGDVDASVAWLRGSLERVLGRAIDSPERDRFDPTLHQALVQFQRLNGLAPDGVAGPHTWIQLGAGLPEPGPKLVSAS